MSAAQQNGAIIQTMEADKYPSFSLGDVAPTFDWYQKQAASQQLNNNQMVNAVAIFAGTALMAYIIGGR